MRRACVSFLSLVLVFICGACSPSVQTSAPPSSTSSLKDVEDVEDVAEVKDVEEAATELTDIFPDLNAVTKVELFAGNTAGRFAVEGVYVNTTEAQATQIIELLSAIDISDFAACIGYFLYRLHHKVHLIPAFFGAAFNQCRQIGRLGCHIGIVGCLRRYRADG